MDGEYFGPAHYFASTVDQGPNKSYLLSPAGPDFPSRWDFNNTGASTPLTVAHVRPGEGHSIWDDWSGRGSSHVDFSNHERLPLERLRFLGHGVNGGVYETMCKGVALAWKTKYCRTSIGPQERKEIEILKKLSHAHIVKLVGTYTHQRFLGLLLWPVAVCDLTTFLEDMDNLSSHWRLKGRGFDYDPGLLERCRALGLPSDPGLMPVAASSRLAQSFGCLAGAIAYLHEQRIRHKDLKPSNILMSSEGLWVADFDTSSDVSQLTFSATNNGERGTPKYFAPEVAAYEPHGRSADIFSLGCIFLEMAVAYSPSCSLEDLKRLRPAKDCSFQANLDQLDSWFALKRARYSREKHLLCEIRQMLSVDPSARPIAKDVQSHLVLIGQLTHKGMTLFPLCGQCCLPLG